MPAVANKNLQGGAFIVTSTDPSQVFIPEDFNEEQLMVAKSCDGSVEVIMNAPPWRFLLATAGIRWLIQFG